MSRPTVNLSSTHSVRLRHDQDELVKEIIERMTVAELAALEDKDRSRFKYPELFKNAGRETSPFMMMMRLALDDYLKKYQAEEHDRRALLHTERLRAYERVEYQLRSEFEGHRLRAFRRGCLDEALCHYYDSEEGGYGIYYSYGTYAIHAYIKAWLEENLPSEDLQGWRLISSNGTYIKSTVNTDSSPLPSQEKDYIPTEEKARQNSTLAFDDDGND